MNTGYPTTYESLGVFSWYAYMTKDDATPCNQATVTNPQQLENKPVDTCYTRGGHLRVV